MAMSTLDGMRVVDGFGTASLEGVFYDRDPAEGGLPMIALMMVDHLGAPSNPVALSLDHAAGLIAELTNRAETMGLGDALRARVDQHIKGSQEFTRNHEGPAAGVLCAKCGAQPERQSDGSSVFRHKPGCPNEGKI